MSRFLPAFSVALTCTALRGFAGELNSLTADEKAAGWKLLFDGKTTQGWVSPGKTEFPAKGWKVSDGTLLHEKGAGGGDIVTAESFGDFEFQWQWKIGEAGNSGVKYNLPIPARGVGFEYQLIDDERHPDGLKGGRKRQTAAVYDLFEPPADKASKPVRQWNESRIIVDGNRVEHWLNGQKAVGFTLGSPELKAAIAASKYKAIPNFGEKTTSPILLQDHGDEVAVRNVKVRALPAK